MIRVTLLALLLPLVCYAKQDYPQLNSKISTKHPVVSQNVVLSFELVVDGYFNGPSSFDLPSLSSARLTKSSDFAVNGSRRDAGKTLASQLWEVNLYPEQTGLLEIPALVFNIEYIDSTGKPVKQSLHSRPLRLFAYLPDDLQGVSSYLASPQVTVSDSWTGQKDQYEKGDIIQRQIQIEAQQIQSIQIPHFEPKQKQGIRIVQAEPQLSDNSNRGQRTAKMTQSLSYIINQAGSYKLGGETLHWWHVEQGEKLAEFEVYTIKVAGVRPVFYWIALAILLTFILLSWGYFAIKKRPASIRRQLGVVLRAQNWHRLVTLLYQQADQNTGLGLLKTGPNTRLISQLMSALYARRQNKKTTEFPKQQELKKLIK